MFDTPAPLTRLLVCADPGSNRHAFDAALQEAARRGVRRHEIRVLSDGRCNDFVMVAGVHVAPGMIDLSGSAVQLVGEAHGARVFASSPDRIVAAEIEAAGADVVVAPGLLPFTRTVAGKIWHSCGPLSRPANDGTPRVWCSLLSAGATPGTIDIEHIAVAYAHEDAAFVAAASGGEFDELTTGRWRETGLLPKDEAKAAGTPLAPTIIRWAPGASNLRWPQLGDTKPLAAGKFADPVKTANGETRAQVALEGLHTLWINTGTLCNLSCANCYIESTPRNDRLAYISASEVRLYLDEIARDGLPTREIGFTGGEPFLNPHIIEMLEDALSRGFSVLMLTNAMKPMRRFERALLDINARYGERLTMRVSLDHYTPHLHEVERGPRSWAPSIDGLKWLSRHGFALNVAGRMYSGETEGAVRTGYANLFSEIGLRIDARDPVQLVVFPEMDASVDVPEITDACWGILGKAPSDVMCASSRMVVKRKEAEAPAVLACTLLAYDERFELGRTLKDASGPVSLNHPHCAKFCVLGGAACSR
jgi:uncharacterized Fe-S cluster-containing radical SAM superfamily protein